MHCLPLTSQIDERSNHSFVNLTKRFLSHTKQKQVRGFTLVEILIVLFIISIVTSIAMLSISYNHNKKIETFANELTQLLTLAEEQAMLQPSILGVSFSQHTFQFASFKIMNEKKKTWVLLDDSILGKHNIPNDIELKIKASDVSLDKNKDKEEDEDIEQFNPQIIISTNGDVTPFAIYIGKEGEKPLYVIIGDTDGSITNKPLS